MKASANPPAPLPPLAELKTSAPSPSRASVTRTHAEMAAEDHDERMLGALTVRARGPVQAKAAVDYGYGDLIAATRATPPRGQDATGMPAPVRAKMEAALGADFSDVRVHPGSTRAVELGAQAFTQGSDIHVAPGQWAPETTQGQELLGHELGHVLQQRTGQVKATAQLQGVGLNDEPALEAKADAIGAQAARGESAHEHLPSNSPRAGVVQRKLSEQKIDVVFEAWVRELARAREAPLERAKLDASLVEAALQKTQTQVGAGNFEGYRPPPGYLGGRESAVVPGATASHPSSTSGFRSMDVTKLNDAMLEDEYQMVQRRLLERSDYPERAADEAYLEVIEEAISRRHGHTGSEAEGKAGGSTKLVELNYDELTTSDGSMKSADSASELIHDWRKLEQVYQDAARGNPRARKFVQDLEKTFAALGSQTADDYAKCNAVPAMQCWVNWDKIDFLRRDQPGAARLRYTLYESFEARSKEINAWTQLAIAFANAVIAGVTVKAALSQAKLIEVTPPEQPPVPKPLTAEGGGAQTSAAAEAKATAASTAKATEASTTAPKPSVGGGALRAATAEEARFFSNHGFTYDPVTGVATKTVGTSTQTARLNSSGEWVLYKDGIELTREYVIAPYKNTPPGAGGFFNAHHPVQDAWAVRRLGQLPDAALKDPTVKYRSGDEPAIQLRDRYTGSPHRTISTHQEAREGSIATRDYATERAAVEKDLAAANVPAARQKELLERVDAYFKTLHDNIKDPVVRKSIFGDYFSKD